MKIIDITKGIFSTPVYPGDPEPELSQIASLDEGDPFNLSVIKACLHTGTHIDSPRHYFNSGASVDELPLEMFIGKCVVSNYENINKETFKKDIKIMLLKGKKEINTDVAERIITLGFITIGTELETIGDNEVHSFLLERHIGIIENLELRDVEEGEYFIFAPPVKVEGSDGAFTRAVLLKDCL